MLPSQNWNKLVPATVGEQAYMETGQFPKVACWGVVASQVVREQSLNKLVPGGMFDVVKIPMITSTSLLPAIISRFSRDLGSGFRIVSITNSKITNQHFIHIMNH